MTTEQIANNEVTYLQAAIEHAPKSAPWNPALRGWWTPMGTYICAPCAARILARGARLPAATAPVYCDDAEPYGVCFANH